MSIADGLQRDSHKIIRDDLQFYVVWLQHEDPRGVKRFFNVRRDDICRALSKEYLEMIRRIEMSWDAK
ncbi:MAG: hypothetical protein GSR79_07775 [Desulfurococcales archaeon]|nr:hypothetical protein [Desulfurococcales archaeon]